MEIKAAHLCRCGHVAAAHTQGIFSGRTGISTLREVISNSEKYGRCGRCSETNGTCKKFQLPNLDLIEYLAKQKGLI